MQPKKKRGKLWLQKMTITSEGLAVALAEQIKKKTSTTKEITFKWSGSYLAPNTKETQIVTNELKS